MEGPVLYKFMEELRQQARFGLLAFQQLKVSLNTPDSERVFLFVHAFLGHALAVARLLWPTRSGSSERGQCLRTELEVGENSALGLGELRGQLENTDERYEDWLKRLDNRKYVDMNVMPAAALGGFKPDAFQRSLDPDTFKLELRGAACDLRHVADALGQMELAIQYWLRSHNPW